MNKKFNLFAQEALEYERWLRAFAVIKCIPEKPIFKDPPPNTQELTSFIEKGEEKVEENSEKMSEKLKEEVNEPLVEEPEITVMKEQKVHKNSKIKRKHKVDTEVDKQSSNEEIKTTYVTKIQTNEAHINQDAAKLYTSNNHDVMLGEKNQLVVDNRTQSIDQKVTKIVPIVPVKKTITLISPEEVSTIQQSTYTPSKDMGELIINERSKTTKTTQGMYPAKVPIIIKDQT